MANSSLFSFTNVAVDTATVSPINIQPVTCYARIEDEPTSVVLSNKTAPLDQGELITYRGNKLDKVSTTQVLQNPSIVKDGVQYVIKAEEILRTKDADGNIICDEPVVAYLTIRHQCSGNITSALIAQTVQRVLGAAMKADGTWRFDDLMRLALVPIVD